MTDPIEAAALALIDELVPTSPSAAPGQNMLPPNTRCDVGETPLWRAHDGPATLFVHGWDDTHRIWRQFAQDFIMHANPVLLMDLPAHGASKATEFGSEHAGQAVYDVCEAHTPITAIVAHSFGCVAAANAIKLGARADRMVLIAPPVLGWRESKRRSGVDEAVIDRVMEIIAEAGGGELGAFDFEDALSGYDGDLLFIGSEADMGCPLDEIEILTAKLDGANVYGLSGLDHRELCLSRDVFSQIQAFLE